MADYIPAPDAEFNAWQANFVSYANANLAAIGLVAADMTPITTAQTTWAAAFPAHVTTVAAAIAAKAAKDGARVSYVALLRALVRRLQASPLVSDAERGGLGITTRGLTGRDGQRWRRTAGALFGLPLGYLARNATGGLVAQRGGRY